MGPSATSVRAFVEVLSRWLEAAHEHRFADARYYAREVGVIARLLGGDPGFRRLLSMQPGERDHTDGEAAIRGMHGVLATLTEALRLVQHADEQGAHELLTGSAGDGAHDSGMESATTRSHLVWSGRECAFPRAGVYYGLAPGETLHAAATGLLPRRGAVYPGARTEVRSGESAPLVYFAVRDPSAVRVIPVKGHAAAGDAAHVSLVFRMNGAGHAARVLFAAMPEEDLVTLERLREEAEKSVLGGFVMSIGLRKDREREFFEKVVLEPPLQPFALLCEHIQRAAAEVCD